MSKDFNLGDKKNIDMYLVLLRYFDGRIENINSKTLKNLKKGKDKDGEIIEPINNKILKQLRMILTLKKENPSEYSSINFIYPDWSEEEKLKALKNRFPNIPSPAGAVRSGRISKLMPSSFSFVISSGAKPGKSTRIL